MFCLLVVLSKSSLLAKWLARKTLWPNRGEGIISIKPRPKSAHDFLGLLYCFIVLLCICVVSCHYVIYYPTVTARYSLFVLKVPLNPKQTNKQTALFATYNVSAVNRPTLPLDWQTWRFCTLSVPLPLSHLIPPHAVTAITLTSFLRRHTLSPGRHTDCQHNNIGHAIMCYINAVIVLPNTKCRTGLGC